MKKTAEKFGMDYTDEERIELSELYAQNLKPIHEAEIVKGTVIGINDREVIINIGVKSDAIVAISEFRDMPELKPGDEVEVYVEAQENSKGQLILSRKKAKLMKAWYLIQEAADTEQEMVAFVKRRTKGGLIVDLEGIEAFLPGSQIDIKPVRDFDAFVGKHIDVAVIKINHATDNVVVSHKAIIEKSLENQKSIILSKLEKGQILEGIVKNMTTFGVFVGLGGIDGLLHITDIAWRRISHPEEVLELGQKIQVVVTDFDEEKKRISLGMKQLTPHPWEGLPADLQVGSKVKGKIVNIADYGAFLELMPGVEGLIHISEMSWSQHLKKVQDLLQVGDELEAVILSLDREEKKISLGIKQLAEDPWSREDLKQKYAPGTKHTGIIRNLAHFGALIELEVGIDGLLHVSDLSWTKKINHPVDVLKLGDQIEVVILELDQENRRLSLGLKQLQENPWESYEDDFQVESMHTSTIVKKTDKGAFVELPHGLEGFVPKRHLIKEDGEEAGLNEQLAFQVIEFSKINKRIVLALPHTLSKKKKENVVSRDEKQAPSRAKSHINNYEKSTLGDIEELATLKRQLEENKDS
jgi:small subunit ribosomal protein S1